MTERKFTRVLHKPGMAAQLRESVSQVVRDSAVLNQHLLVEPIDFENFVLKNKTLIQNDPQRELLIYPNDDVSQIVLPRKTRTTTPAIPKFNNPFNGFAHASDGPPFDSLSKSHSTTNSTNSSDDETYVSAASSESNLTYGGSGGSGNAAGTNGLAPVDGNGLLLTRQALQTYRSNNHLVVYKYAQYAGTQTELPKLNIADEVYDEVYEVDTDPERIDEQMTRSQADTTTKQGFLLKGPDTSSDRIFVHIGSKSFKRRYCYLRQEVDGTYILDLHKDDKQCEAKTTYVMDFCTDVVPNTKRGRFCFELCMTAGHKSVTLAAENEADLADWLSKLKSVVRHHKAQEDKRNASLERSNAAAPATATPASPAMMYGTLKGLDQSMNPQLIRYGRETDVSIAQARREKRRHLFNVYRPAAGGRSANALSSQSLASNASAPEIYREKFGQRIHLKCENLRFRLQAPLASESANDSSSVEVLRQVEPYITSLALYDAKAGRKLTENFHFDVNEDCVRDLFEQSSSESRRRSQPVAPDSPTASEKTLSTDWRSQMPANWFRHPRWAMFSIKCPHPDIFVVVKIDKILQGSISSSAEPYMKASKDPKLAVKLQRNVLQCNRKIGHFRMPFAWAARPLFKMYSNELDTSTEFPAIYRQEANRLRDEDLLRMLGEYRKPDKFGKMAVAMPGWLRMSVELVVDQPNHCLTTSLVPVRPFPLPINNEDGLCLPTVEVAEFPGNNVGRDICPFVTYRNHLFVYPLALNFESQKMFSRARNISIIVEVRESDAEGARALKCIYGRPPNEYAQFVTRITCPVLHHSTAPTWYEEIKIRLPLNLSAQHHLLFSFVHVSCDMSKKREPGAAMESPVGFAWLPLLHKGRVNVDEQCLPVAASLPPGYLSIQPLGLGRGNCGPDIQWIDGQRALFSLAFRIDSTVLTTDQHLHNLFQHIDRVLSLSRAAAQPTEKETCKILKAAHAIHVTSVITFLPTLLNQLFQLLVHTTSDEIGLNVIRLLVNLMHMIIDEAGRRELLTAYVKYVFQTGNFTAKRASVPSSETSSTSGNSTPPTSVSSGSSVHTVHGELCRHLPVILHPNNTDFLIVNKFMKNSGIFFDIIVKSIGQHLLGTGRIRMLRNERLPASFAAHLEQLVQVLVGYLHQRPNDLTAETNQMNRNLSAFLNRCLSFMDRGFVFRMIRTYLERFRAGDPRTLHELKFVGLAELCTHEHYIPLNLPFRMSPANRMPDILQHFSLSEEFCRQHFLAGVLLQEVRCALNEVSPIRTMALGVLRDVIGKHELDDRYQHRGQQERIAMLYVPWLGIVLANAERLANYEHKKCRSDTTSLVSQRYSTCGIGGDRDAGSYVRCFDSDAPINGTPRHHRNRITLHIDHPSSAAGGGGGSHNGTPVRSSMHIRDGHLFAAIAGNNGCSTHSLDSHESSLISQDTAILRFHQQQQQQQHLNGHSNGDADTLNGNGGAAQLRNGDQHNAYQHNRSVSVATAQTQPAGPLSSSVRYDKLTVSETRDMLVVFLFVVRHVAIDQMVMWWQSCSTSETLQYFSVLEMCLINFRYVGLKNIVVGGSNVLAGGGGGASKPDQVRMRHAVPKASTLPARIVGPSTGDTDDERPHDSCGSTLTHPNGGRENLLDEATRAIRSLHESNLATEVGLIVLDSIGLYSLQFRDQMIADSANGANGSLSAGLHEKPVLVRIAGVYLRFLQLGQSETLSKHVFAALRAFINNFASAVLFRGTASLCGQLVFELLKCCDSRLATLRQEACAVLYLLMRSNFEFTGHKGLTRVHLQVIISVSQMLGNVCGLNNARFQESLSLINSYANSDKAMKGTGFPGEVKDLTRRVRTVLMATAQMQSHHTDPERLLELQLSLANSYASTPELRHTWLVTMARHHEQRGHLSEAACCHLHIAALMSEYLRLRGSTAAGEQARLEQRCSTDRFGRISRNIPRDEKGLKLDSGAGGASDSQYSEQMLLDQLKECTEWLDRAERYECLAEVYRMIVPVYEERRDYTALAGVYEHLTQSYTKINEVNRSGKRLLGRFYRVAFFGQMYFEDDNAVEYVYKEPKVTSLPEISERLQTQYRDKFGADVLKIIMDSCVVDPSTLDPKLAYVQITHVTPYFCKDELEERQNDFEQNHDVDTFAFETPFTRTGGARGSIEDQWKRRTILTTQYTFPYVLTRIPVIHKQSIELSPIDVAIDEMQTRVAELEDVVLPPIDVKKLQLRLQGSVAVTVNAGALAYATVFLDPKRSAQFPDDRVDELKTVFREFICICSTALHINGRMISADQREYQIALQENYEKLCTSMAGLIDDDSFLPQDKQTATGVHRQSMALFSAISGAPNNSSHA